MTVDRLEAGLRSLLAPAAADGDEAAHLYRYAVGEASPEEARLFEAHLQTCAHCREDLTVFKGLPTPVAPEAMPSLLERLLGWVSGWRLAPLAAIAALLVVLVWQLKPNAPDGSTFLIKGGYTLQVALERGTERSVAVSGSSYQVGDRLGFFYTAPAESYLTLWFLDETGEVTRAFPEGAVERVPAGSEVRLPSGATIEAGTACEWVIAVFSPTPPSLEALVAQLKASVARPRVGCTLPLSLSVPTGVFVVERQAR